MQADRKMEPWMLRDLAQIARDHTWGKDTDWTRHIDAEAARREAEAKELGRETSAAAVQTQTQGEREGPGSAAAPTEPVICTVCLMPAKWGDECRSSPCPYPKRPVEDKPAPAADDLPTVLRATTEAMASVASGMSMQLWNEHSNAALQAADRIEAQARELEGIYKALATHGVRVPEIHNAADGIAAMRRALDEQMARVRELEAETKLNGELVDSAQEHARNAHVKYLAEKARSDGLAAGVRMAKTQIEYQRGATTPQAAQHWTEVVLRTLNAALTEGGA